MPSQSPSADPEYRFAFTLWLAMLASIAMYFVVIRTVRPAQPVDNPDLARVLLLTASALVVASFALRRRFEARARSENNRALYRSGFILGLVLSEAAALLGVVVWFVSAYPHYYLFLIIGTVAMLLHYPRRPD